MERTKRTFLGEEQRLTRALFADERRTALIVVHTGLARAADASSATIAGVALVADDRLLALVALSEDGPVIAYGRDPQDAQVLGVALLDERGRPTSKVIMGQTLTLCVLTKYLSSVPIGVTVSLKNRYDQVVSSFGSYTLGLAAPQTRVGDVSLLELKMSAMLEAGLYSYRVTLGRPASLPNRGACVAETPWLGPFTVSWDYDNERAPFMGMFGVPVVGRFCKIEDVV